MQDFIGQYYNWFKAFHIIAVMAWMAGMLYLPRLFVYHADVEVKSDTAELFKIMEYRLLKFIMNPAMILAWIFGISMFVGNPDLFQYPWMHLKLTAIVIMTMIHHVYGRWQKNFMQDKNNKTAKFYKVWNEIPTILLITIVIMAVVEPF